MTTQKPAPKPGRNSIRPPTWLSILLVAWLAIVLIAYFLPRRPQKSPSIGDHPKPGSAPESGINRGQSLPAFRPRRVPGATDQTPEEIVAQKLARFSEKRLELVHAMASHFKVGVPDDVERFFKAEAAGRFEEAHALYESLKARRYGNNDPDLTPYWRAIVETEGAAEQVHTWPAQKLLDYGNSVLGSLRPGMAYVGGDDPGCFIPTMLNETSEGENHIVLTQNALADSSYLDYLRFLYGDRLQLPSADDSKTAFQDYMADAQKRMLHDQQFPDEPKLVLPGEKITMSDGRVQVTGQVAVMSINELLLKDILRKNPDLSFALEESFPLKSTYADATTLGPVMELRAADGQKALTADAASQSVAYWQATAQQLLSDPTTPEGSDARKSYGHLAEAQANLLASHNFTDQAEQAYRLADSLWPDSVNLLSDYSEFLAKAGKFDEANQLIDQFLQNYPTNRIAVEKVRQALPRAPGH